MLAHKFRLYPNKGQEKKLEFTLDVCRQTYNMLLEKLQKQTKINRSAIQHKIVELKQENPIKPVFAKGKVYRRVGRTNQKLSSLEIRELTRKGVDYNFTELICKDCDLEDIDEKKIKEYVARAKEERNFSIVYKSKKRFS